DVHREMLLAAADAGVKGVFCEKPVCDRLDDVDEVIAACDRTGMQVVMAHQTRYSPIWAMVKTLMAANKIGNILEIRARGKEDMRGGMEDMLVLGTHLFDMVQDVWGMPEWCFGTLRGPVNDAQLTTTDLRDAGDGMFRVAGDAVHAMYGLKEGRMLYFDTVNDGRGGARFGLRIYGSQGIIEVGMGYMPPAYLFPHRTWSPIRGKKDWMPISSAGLNKEEPIPEAKRALHWGNVAACEDLLDVLTHAETGRRPVADIRQARTSLEMVVAPIAAAISGRPVRIPLVERGNPLDAIP
ncbi:MAG: Gfo/Idh/MocA family oxidoreductase, partial [Planctomycetia bacterium]|nr:Gfo/Idh/MocA family oxidoreductase [Planctomycetia bacterium]